MDIAEYIDGIGDDADVYANNICIVSTLYKSHMHGHILLHIIAFT